MKVKPIPKFWSQSATNARQAAEARAKQQIVKIEHVFVESPIVWFGLDYRNLFSQGVLYDFKCRWYADEDLSSLTKAKALVFSRILLTNKVINIINFACECGTPSIWFNKYLPSNDYFWSFTHKLHLNDSQLLWKDLCHLIK